MALGHALATFGGRGARLVNAVRLRASGVPVGAGSALIGLPIVTLEPDSAIHIGRRVTLISKSRRTALGVSHPVILRTLRSGAVISIGDESGLSGTTICAAISVEIGRRVLIGADVVIADTDFHPVDVIPRHRVELPQPSDADRVTVGDDVFIGARCIVLKGSRIGSGSVIGAGSVVAGDIPPRSVAVGNPARPVRAVGAPAAIG